MSAVTPISQQRDIQQAEVRTFRQRVSAVFGSYTFRVIMQGLLTIWAVVTFTFFLIRLLPGNPIDIKIDQLMQQRNITYEEALSQAAALYHLTPMRRCSSSTSPTWDSSCKATSASRLPPPGHKFPRKFCAISHGLCSAWG